MKYQAIYFISTLRGKKMIEIIETDRVASIFNKKRIERIKHYPQVKNKRLYVQFDGHSFKL